MVGYRTESERCSPAHWRSPGSAGNGDKVHSSRRRLTRLATRHFLESQTGFEVCGEAIDGIDALEKASHLNPDLIILDIAMPRMNGLQTARELRARM